MPTAGSTTARGYGTAHQQARRVALRQHQDGDPCTRCGQPMYRTQALDLDHTNDRAGYLGLAHRHCNRRAGGIKGNRTRGRGHQQWTSTTW